MATDGCPDRATNCLGMPDSSVSGLEVRGMNLEVHQDSQELQLLRDFYRMWNTFHQFAKDKQTQENAERACQTMLDLGKAIEGYYKTHPKVS